MNKCNKNNSNFNKHFGFNDDDLTFLFGKNKNKAIKSLESLYDKNSKYTDYDVLDILSHGHGREAYVKLSNHRIKSEEYLDNFQIINNRKHFDLTTSEGKDRHINRNKNQYNKAPKDLATMNQFVERGYFINEGFNPCHNLSSDDVASRKAALSTYLYRTKHNLMHDEKQANSVNISFRGTPGSSFEGCQFIYNKDSGKLVTDCLNRGTWDYGKYGTHAHYTFDIVPWLSIGNGSNNETPDMFIMSHKDEQMYLKTSFNQIKEQIANDLGTRTAKIIKEESSSESLALDPEFILKERKRIYMKSVENACQSFIEHTDKDEKFLSFLDHDWNNYISFCTMVDDKSLIAGLEMFVNSMDSDPSNLKDLITDSNQVHYKDFLLTSSIICLNNDEFKVGTIVKNDMPITLKINLNRGFVERLQNCSNQDVAIKEFHKIRDELIIPTISERLGKISFKCRVLDDVVDTKESFESFILTISQLRTISKEEETAVLKANEKVIPVKEFAKEDLNTYHAPEYSFEGILEMKGILTGLGATILVSGIFGTIIYLFDKFIWSKNRKIIKIIQDNMDIFSTPLKKDYVEYTDLYNKVRKDTSFINSLYTIDPYGKYQFTTINSNFCKDSFLKIDHETFGTDVVNKIFYAIKATKNKSPKVIKDIFDNIHYTYVIAEGKPLLELLTEITKKIDTVYDPITGKYKETNPRDKDSLLISIGGFKSSYKNIKKLIESECAKMGRKGYDIRPVFFINDHRSSEDVFLNPNKPDSLKSIKVAFYLCMPTSIQYGQFLQLKELIDSELSKDESKK